MTPLQLEILLHYYYSAEDYPDRNANASAVRDALAYFLTAELLARTGNVFGKGGPVYQLAQRGRVYIKALLNAPLPELVPARWEMPKDEFPSDE